MHVRRLLHSTVAAVALAASGSAVALEAEVVHWWTSGGESKAIGVIAEEFKNRGGTWIDTAVVGGSNARAATINRILGGDPPTAMQWNIGVDVLELAEQDLINDIDAVATAGKWADVLPPLVVERATYDGKFVVVPVNVHADNWMWYSPAIFEEVGLEPPTDWEQFLVDAEKIKAAGYIPVALGGQPWQERILFNSVLIGTAGKEAYRALYVDRDPEAARSEGVLKALEVFGKLRPFVDDGSPGRNWNDATNLVLTGKAAAQFMGDWAKGEFAAAGMEPGKDYGCAMPPGNDDAYVLVVDVFAFAKTEDPEQREAQEVLAE
ncbi:MAG: ABC transporter substrate-binding protein, partial [Pseudomonadota bacterium]